MNVHELLDEVKTKLHEEFGPEVGRRATQIIDSAKVDAEPAEGEEPPVA